jgi:hypothetical protein
LITHALGGHLPQRLADRWQAIPSLSPEAGFIRGDAGLEPIAIDESYADDWAQSLSALLEDPDAELPRS